jgi:ketosteroid isomerase-like protein
MHKHNSFEINQLNRQNAEYIYQAWNQAWSDNNIAALLALYADDIIIESPLIPYLLGKAGGVCEGKEALRKLLEVAAARKPIKRQYHRHQYFTDGKTLIWEYPRVSPQGEQMDFVEVMELREKLIIRHRVYWGWLGFDILKNDQYYR